MIPTFVCIGGQRCGTTWLHRMLDELPHVHVCKSKETDYFYTNILRDDLAVYERNFEPPDGQLPFAARGELSPNYCMLKRPSIELIHKLYPQLRLLLVIREPVERTLSQTWLNLRYMSGDTETPLQALDYLRHLERQRTKRRNDYARIIRDWRAVFGPAALHIELYDDLCRDPGAFLRRVLRHIGVDDEVQLPEAVLREKVFESTKSPVPPLVRWYLAKDYRENVRRLNDLLEGHVSHWLTAMDAILGQAPLGWQLARGLNKCVFSVPEKIAYVAYDSWRDMRLARRGQHILNQRHAELAKKTPTPTVRKTAIHRENAGLTVL